MPTTLETISSVQHKLKISVPHASVDSAFTKAFKRIQKKARIQGFRPGKAPISIIKQMYKPNVLSDVADALIKENLQSALEETKIEPVAQPVVNVETLPEEGKDYNFEAVVDTMPKLEVTEYKGLKIEAPEFEITDEAVDKQINQLRYNQAQSEEAAEDAGADEEHVITLKQSATLDGKPVADLEVDKFDVVLGQTELLPELEQAIRGIKKGESKTVDLSVPTEYSDKDLAGKTVQMVLEGIELKKLKIPSLDDEFAKDLNVDSFDELKVKVRESMVEQTNKRTKEAQEAAILDQLIEKHDFEVPPSLVDQVIDGLINDMRWDDEDKRKEALKDQELRKEKLPLAKRQAKNTFILWKVAEAEGIKVEESDIQARIDEMISTQFSQINDEKTINMLKQRMRSNLAENLLFEKALGRLVELAEVTKVATKV